MDPLSVLDVWACCEGHHVAKADAQVVPHHTVHPDLLVGDGVVREDDAGGLLALLTLQQDSVAAEQLRGGERV